MERQNYGSGAPWEAIVGYSRAVRAGGRIHVTGTVGEGEDAYAQATDAFAKIAAVLERAGASLADVLRTRIYVTDIARDWEAVGRAHKEALGETMPATSMVQVGALIKPDYVVEIEADAQIGLAPATPRAEPAPFNDTAVAALLVEAGLPVPGELDRPVQLRLLREDGAARACAGFEHEGEFALLRSVAVAQEARGRGLGTAMVRRVLAELSQRGVVEVYLLTVGGEGFFERLGFESVAREAAPPEVSASREFELHHCDGAQLMRGRL